MRHGMRKTAPKGVNGARQNTRQTRQKAQYSKLVKMGFFTMGDIMKDKFNRTGTRYRMPFYERTQ